MEKNIKQLLDKGHIMPDTTSPWGFRITLAPNPHQEDVEGIQDYVWRFCINYIMLNMMTRPVEYTIPQYNDAVMYGFGKALLFVLMDAFAGHQQIKLLPSSVEKTVFYAPR
eukprot:7047930-Ditylum_brightwellii.AAC.1